MIESSGNDGAREHPTAWVEVQRLDSRKRALEHALVLQAMGIEHGVLEQPGAFLLLVRAERAATALEELARYERENRGWPPREEPLGRPSDGVIGAAAWCVILVAIDILQRTRAFGFAWWDHGVGHADLERHGELWRAFTGLTLHAGVTHLLSNLLFGAMFVGLTCEAIGLGLGLASVLWMGALGNLMNAWLHAPDHRSVGASTAVFAALGTLVAYTWRRRHQLRHGKFRRFAPILAGAFLLASMGMSSPREELGVSTTDYGAHATGFVAGALFGAIIGTWQVTAALSRSQQSLLAAFALASIAVAWFLALS